MPEPSDDSLDPTERAETGTAANSGQPGQRPDERPETIGEPPTEPLENPLDPRVAMESTEAWNVDFPEGSGDPERWDGTTVANGESRAEPLIGSRVRYLGDYELLGIVGRGGMGIVYQARQISLNRLVALKLIRHEESIGEPEIRRFQHEAEAVASLDHPGIVPIYEIGEHQERHYFSMKLISGPSLQKASQRLRGNFPAIGRILAAAARAVQHAHERGILHRDLKPGNIVLDEKDAPHITDFGLSKRIDPDPDDLTQSVAVMGTPAYMAPEQTTATRGMITTATDVYGLGAVLYALLSGHAPHRGSSILEVLDAVRYKAPEPPSKLDPTIPRDLEVICMKCLDKEPKNRYHSAEELANDLDRWLERRPISARSVGKLARIVMWSRRKPVLAGLLAALLISTVVGSTGILINWREVRRQRDELIQANLQIQSERDAVRALNEFLVSDLLAWSSPYLASRRDVPVSTLLDRSARQVATRFARQPKIEASIRQILGNSYSALGLLPKAEAQLIASARIREQMPAEDELDRLSAELALANLRVQQGRYAEAEAHATRAYQGRLKLLGANDQATFEAAESLGITLKFQRKVDDSLKLLEKTAETASQALGLEDRQTLRILTSLAIIEHDENRLDEAFTNLERITEIRSRIYGADDPETLLARSRLGGSLHTLGHDDLAEEVLEQVLGPDREILGPDHPETLTVQNNLAAVRCNLGRYGQAAQQLQETLESQRKSLPANHKSRFATEINLAVALLEQGKFAEAEPMLRNLVTRMRQNCKEDDPDLGKAIFNHVAALRNLNQTVEAETLNNDLLVTLRKLLPEGAPEIVDAEAVQAALLLANGKSAEAETVARRVFESRSKPGATVSRRQLGSIQSTLGAALAAQKDFVQARPFLLKAIELLQSDPKAPKQRTEEAIDRLIRVYDALDDPTEAARWRTRRDGSTAP